jgi:hypothetical protein
LKEKGSGVVSGGGAGATVVILKSSLTPPILRVTLVVVELLAEEFCLTIILSPSDTVEEPEIKAPHPMLYSPQPLMDIGVSVLIPCTVMMLESYDVLSSASVISSITKVSGVVSGGGGGPTDSGGVSLKGWLSGRTSSCHHLCARYHSILYLSSIESLLSKISISPITNSELSCEA